MVSSAMVLNIQSTVVLGEVASWIGVKSNSPTPSTSSPGCLRCSDSNQECYD